MKIKIDPIDINGKNLQIGDWVRVVAVPLSVQNMPDDTKEAFSRAVGETLQIESFNEIGYIELDFWPKLGCDTIWLEPYCVKRFRRYKKFSKRFKKILELNKELECPRYMFSYKAIWPVNGSHDESVLKLEYAQLDIGQGWSVWPEERLIQGHFSILKHKVNALQKITKCRDHIGSLTYFDKIEVGEIKTEESNNAN